MFLVELPSLSVINTDKIIHIQCFETRGVWKVQICLGEGIYLSFSSLEHKLLKDANLERRDAVRYINSRVHSTMIQEKIDNIINLP